jgi:hypothetical protein
MNQNPFRVPTDFMRLQTKYCDLASEICVPQLYNAVLCFKKCQRLIDIDKPATPFDMTEVIIEYVDCPGNIKPFGISREPLGWP